MWRWGVLCHWLQGVMLQRVSSDATENKQTYEYARRVLGSLLGCWNRPRIRKMRKPKKAEEDQGLGLHRHIRGHLWPLEWMVLHLSLVL